MYNKNFSLLKHRSLCFVLLLPGFVAFAAAWPKLETQYASPQEDAGAPQCRGNLIKISQAMAQYAQDYDDRFPLATTPVDKTRKYRRNKRYWEELTSIVPPLHTVLWPYLPNRTAWNCPSESPGSRPSGDPNERTGTRVAYTYSRQGTSYYYRSFHGLMALQTADIIYPSRGPVVYDDNAWHSLGKEQRLNVLFVDGHVENLGWNEFDAKARYFPYERVNELYPNLPSGTKARP